MGNEFEVVVAGGGIAGLTAGLKAAQLGRRTLLLTGTRFGGNLLSIETIEGLPDHPDGIAGYELLPAVQADAAAAGVEFEATELTRLERAPGAWRLTTDVATFSAKAVILATGAAPKPLGIPGEEVFRDRGVSHCASCDGPLLNGRVVAVVGGGDSALQESLTLASSVARVVIVQNRDRLTAQQRYVDRVAANPNIEIRFGTTVTEIIGDARVSGVNLANGDAIPCDAVFVYIGLAPDTAYLDSRLAVDAAGRIPTDSEMATERPGLFAAGLVRAGSPGRAAASACEATAAAVAADRWLRNGG